MRNPKIFGNHFFTLSSFFISSILLLLPSSSLYFIFIIYYYACFYQFCIYDDYFRESALAINPLFPDGWFALGAAALKVINTGFLHYFIFWSLRFRYDTYI